MTDQEQTHAPQPAPVSVTESGTGTPVLLLHGSPGTGRSWARVARHLESGFRLIMPDLPGHGKTPGLGNATDFATRTTQIADAMLPWLDQFEAPLLIAGHSFGATIALHLALKRPARVRSLLLLEPVFFRALVIKGQMEAYDTAASFFRDYATRVTGGDHGAVSRMIDFWYGAGAFSAMPEAIKAYLKANAELSAKDVLSSLLDNCDVDRLRNLKAACLLAYGLETPAVARQIIEALASILPDARIHPLPGAHHGMIDTHPAEVAGLIRAMTA